MDGPGSIHHFSRRGPSKGVLVLAYLGIRRQYLFNEKVLCRLSI